MSLCRSQHVFLMTLHNISNCQAHWKFINQVSAAVVDDERGTFATDAIRALVWEATTKNYTRAVDLLIKMDVDVDWRNTADGATPLWLAVYHNRDEIAILLVNAGADVNVTNNKNQTPLYWAIRKGFHNITAFLIDNRADVNTTDDNGDTPLHWAIEKYDERLVNHLLEKGADADKANKVGETPLFCAAAKGHDRVATLLIKNKARVNKKNRKGATPLCVAVSNGCKCVVRVLLNAGAKITDRAINDAKPRDRVDIHFMLEEAIEEREK